ncbi:MAG: hypothetical protein RIE77_02345 [Phycisphaerales bacterium]|jgi:hypothetical protein
MRTVRTTISVGALAMAGCNASLPADFEAPDAGSRIRAVIATARQPTHEDLTQMVRALNSDDPALRSLSIAALQRTAGDRFGYDAWAPEPERRAAIDRWKRWLDERKGSGPAASTTP